MGFALTVLYIVLTVLSPEQFGPAWAKYHVLEYLAALTFLASFPNILTNVNLRTSVQTPLLLAFVVAIGLSQIANGWFGGAIEGWSKFMPSAAVFFFIVANVTTVRRLQIGMLAVAAASLLLAVEALSAYYGGWRSGIFVLQTNLYEHEEIVGQLSRIRGAGFLSDPNDFAQILLIALPLIFVAWRQGRIITNLLMALVPVALLLWATFLTHSRGALIGLAVVALIASRKRLGTTISTALTCLLVLGMLALDFTGGRVISASEGADRLEAWATGLELFKGAPLFGIGFGAFTDFNDITAHNSFVLCLAELGLIGSTIWMALLVTTTMGLNRLVAEREEPAMTGEGRKEISNLAVGEDEPEIISNAIDADQGAAFEDQSTDCDPAQSTDGDRADVVRIENQSWAGNVNHEIPTALGKTSPPSTGWTTMTETAAVDDFKVQIEMESVHELIVPNKCVVAIRLALVSFMATSWFLSRSYATTMYLVLGLATAAIALERPVTETWDRVRWIPVTLAVEAMAIILIYFAVRLRH